MEREVNMARANNSPTNLGKPDLTSTEMGDLLELFDEFRRLPPVSKNDVPELNRRLDSYFKACSDSGILPTVESMCLMLGVSRQGVWKWQQDTSKAGEIIGRAKEVINSVLSTSAVSGKVNPIYVIWLQKNHFSYSDTQTLEIANVTEKRVLTASELPKLGNKSKQNDITGLPDLSTSSGQLPDLNTFNAD